MPTMKALNAHGVGEPVDVLRLETRPVPDPGPGQVRVPVQAAQVNPNDLHIMRGRYGFAPELPAVPGQESVGILDAWVGRPDRSYGGPKRPAAGRPPGPPGRTRGLGRRRRAPRHRRSPPGAADLVRRGGLKHLPVPPLRGSILNQPAWDRSHAYATDAATSGAGPATRPWTGNRVRAAPRHRPADRASPSC
jgi:hypothetical protein